MKSQGKQSVDHDGSSLFGRFEGFFFVIAVALILQGSSPASAASCESLASLKLSNTSITSAQVVEAGLFKLPPKIWLGRIPGIFKDLPSFCRVTATLKPSSDSDIKIEVWMPVSGWNGKYLATGNGGWAGSINYRGMGNALRNGYATSSTDTGHTERDASFALGHPEKLIDYGYRSVHEMTVKSKAIIAGFYGNSPQYSYWEGCSLGGQQALMEAQRFPEDYDGIIAGAPANNRTNLHFAHMWAGLATLKDAESFIPAEKYPMIHKAVLDACDSSDGVADGVLEDPTQCHFDAKSLQCTGADSSTCLTPLQVTAANKIYAGPKNPRNGKKVYPGLAPGSELGWGFVAGGPQPFGLAQSYFQHIFSGTQAWDFRSLNFDSDVAFADKQDNGTLNAVNPNLSKYFSRGGKLIQYHGWNDPMIAPQGSVDYYRNVAETMGGEKKIEDSYRLFMVPGMNHCGGGDGPSVFDMLSDLEEWVEKGNAPNRIIASRINNGKIDRTRPLCPYPQVAKYKGTGSTDDAANFVCQRSR